MQIYPSTTWPDFSRLHSPQYRRKLAVVSLYTFSNYHYFFHCEISATMRTWNPLRILFTFGSVQSRGKYAELDSEDLPIVNISRPQRPPLKKLILGLLLVFVSSGGTFVATNFLRAPEVIPVNAATATPILPKLTCGNTTSEARAAGCAFDPLIFAWTNPECPRDMVEEHLEFNHGKPWNYWVDKEGIELIPHDNYKTLSHMEYYWTTNSEHLSHCSFMLLRFHKVMRRGGQRIDGLTRSFDHAHHCLMFLLEMAGGHKDYDAIATHGNIGFDDC